MAHQDYVTKKRAPAKKKNVSKSALEKPTQGLSVKMKLTLFFTFVLIIVFALGLWFLKATDKSTLPTNNKSIVTDSKKTTLPTPPKEKWSYMKDLKTKKVEEGHYEVQKKGPYQMQCGSFRTAHQANVLKAKIAFAGVESHIKKSQGKSGLWYKVVLGPYVRKRLAESDKHKLKSNGVNGCQIWLWQ
jgi:cell division protein FtsN